MAAFVRGKRCLCSSCYRKLRPRFFRWRLGRYRCLALYEYETVKEALYQFKGCGDIELAPVFFDYARPILSRRFRSYQIVPAPSSQSHDEARGFNQVVEMCRCLNLPILPILEKTAESKQSDLSAKERKQVGKILALKERGKIKGKRILLVDDVYTTGSTISACLRLLAQEGPKTIKVFVMAKTLPKKDGPF